MPHGCRAVISLTSGTCSNNYSLCTPNLTGVPVVTSCVAGGIDTFQQDIQPRRQEYSLW